MANNKLSSFFQQGLYSPDFVRSPEDIANSIISDEPVVVETKKPGVAVNKLEQIPLTEAESVIIDEELSEVLERINNTRNKIADIKNRVDNFVGLHSNNEELVFDLDISKKPRIKRAIKQVFGIKTNVITYSMYKDLLKAKNLLEKEQAQGYVNGFPEESS